MDYSMRNSKMDIRPGARERIAEKLKDLPKINQERPCKKCIYYNSTHVVQCAYRDCDFYHSAFVPVAETK